MQQEQQVTTQLSELLIATPTNIRYLTLCVACIGLCIK